MRGRSYTPSPPRGYGRRRRSPSPPRGRYGGRGYGGGGYGGYGGRDRDGATSLLVRNLRHDCRPEDLRRPFGQFGHVKDIYLPRDYYTGDPRGFGFVQFMDPEDAAEAKYHLDGQGFQGRQLTVVFAEENRKKPTEMRARDRTSERPSFRGGRDYERRPRYSRSRSPPRRSRDYYSPDHDHKRREYSRSISPKERSPVRDPRIRSRSPVKEEDGSRSRSPNPVREEVESPGRKGGIGYDDSSPGYSPKSPCISPGGRSPSRSRSIE